LQSSGDVILTRCEPEHAKRAGVIGLAHHGDWGEPAPALNDLGTKHLDAGASDSISEFVGDASRDHAATGECEVCRESRAVAEIDRTDRLERLGRPTLGGV